jgi:hemerythrin-like domain-containing protein
MNITEFMTDHHRACDDEYVKAEGLVVDQNWVEASASFAKAYDNFNLHFTREEETLFPTFEEKTGMAGGPTQVMRSEHVRMRATLDELKRHLEDQNKDKFLGLSESFMILVQQHNMKEEQMLYSMMDRVFGEESENLVRQLP